MSGKRERPAHFDIDEKTLEYVENPDSVRESHIDSQQKIGQRKIYKIKMPGDAPKQSSASKPNFQFFQNTEKQKQTKQLENKIQNKNQEVTEKKQQNTKKQQNKQVGKNQQQKKPTSIFGFPQNGSGIFGNGIGLFTNNAGGSNLFSGNNIFAKRDPIPQKSTQSKPTSSIFGTSQSIFNFANNGVPPIKKQVNESKAPEVGGDDEDGDSAELQKQQNKTIDPTKSTGNYEYGSNCQILFQAKALKVKKNNGELVQNVEVIVEKDSQNKMRWVVIRLAATKNPIVTGIIIKGKSDVKKIGNKSQNVTLSALVMVDKKPEKHILKLQFQNAEDGAKFIETVEKLIKQ